MYFMPTINSVTDVFRKHSEGRKTGLFEEFRRYLHGPPTRNRSWMNSAFLRFVPEHPDRKEKAFRTIAVRKAFCISAVCLKKF